MDRQQPHLEPPGEAPITQHEHTVLRAIDEFLDTKPPVTPHTSDLVRATGLSEDEVIDAVRSLERLDYIVIEPPKLGGTGEVTHITKTGQHHL
jgi:DNA-binding MarR family transcriptional regulator